MATFARQIAAPRQSWRARLPLPLAVWLACAAALLIVAVVQGWRPSDPDDYMRMLEVRDLLGGQAWFDVHQYRMNPPLGAAMHWSRLIDLPILAVRVVAGLVLPAAAAERAAMVVVPLLYLLLALSLLTAILKRQGMAHRMAVVTPALTVLFPLLATGFAPFRIDHHTPQALAALACAALLMRAPSPRAALGAGLIAAVLLAISLEGLVLVGALAALYGLRYALKGERSLAWFLAALTPGVTLLSFATRPWSEFVGKTGDVVELGHVAAFAAAAALAAVLPRLPRQQALAGRLAALALFPAVCVPILFAILGRGALDPFSRLDPIVRTWWYDFVLEGLPFWRQVISVQVMLLWTVLLILAGWRIARRGVDPARRDGWDMLALFALAAAGYSLFVMRAAIAAQMLAVPFAAQLLVTYLPRARAVISMVPRVLATVGCLALVTPTGPSALAKPFDPLFVPDRRLAEASRYVTPQACHMRQLANLPSALLFAPLDRGPEIVMLTPHTVVMSGYHRNAAVMREVIEAFGGDLGEAEKRVKASGAQYLLTCDSSFDLAMYRTWRRDNLVTALANGQVPAWLEPVAGYTRGPLHLYRVRS